MQRLSTLVALAVALAVHVNSAMALGFGKVVGNAMLGQTLNLVVPLRLEGGETLEATCVKASVVSGDRPLSSDQVRTRIESEGGERRIRVMTTGVLDEPVVSFDLAAGCPVRLSRQFTVFVDPPYRAVPNAAADTGARPASSVEAVTAPDRAAPPASPPRRPANRAPRAESDGTTSAPTSAIAVAPRARPRPPRRADVPVDPPALRPVLRLDPIEDEALRVPSLRLSTELAALPAADRASRPRFADPEMAQRALDKERLAALEATLKRLQGSDNAQQTQLNDAQAQLREAEAQRYANPLVYALAALCLLLLMAVLALFWTRRRPQPQPAWWNSSREPSGVPDAGEPGAAAAPVDAVLPAVETRVAWESAEAAGRDVPQPWAHFESSGVLPTLKPASPEIALTPSPAYFGTDSGEADAGPRRSVSAEELLDLEQQAEFFVVLGQDEAAIDLLMGHLRSTGGVSPLPYLKLLEIYRRRGEQDAYERIRERFNLRFNAYAPGWDVDPEEGLMIEGYPDVLARLQAAWATPSFAMELLDAALFRRDGGAAFEVPAYRELLFLYGVARDLSERAVEEDGVDLLLPLHEPQAATQAPTKPDVPYEADELDATFIPAAATDAPSGPPPADDMLSLNLDVTLEDTSGMTVKRSPARPGGAAGREGAAKPGDAGQGDDEELGTGKR